MSRNVVRAMARKQYDHFSRDWRRERRMAASASPKRFGKKPSFSEWYHMHGGDAAMLRQSTPSDVREHLGMDPWDDVPPEQRMREAVEATRKALSGGIDGLDSAAPAVPTFGRQQ